MSRSLLPGYCTPETDQNKPGPDVCMAPFRLKFARVGRRGHPKLVKRPGASQIRITKLTFTHPPYGLLLATYGAAL